MIECIAQILDVVLEDSVLEKMIYTILQKMKYFEKFGDLNSNDRLWKVS